MTKETRTKEVPLSLQVFHSSNEYKAHRRNRTEQLRLDDVRDALQREEKLYTKEHALHLSKFSAHHTASRGRFSQSAAVIDRRNSLASSSIVTPSIFSQVTTSTVFSAPAKLQRIGSTSSNPMLKSSLASQLCTSLSRLSTSTRFQRIQRQFSLASFTKNGMITKKGKAMSKNIPKARDILFKRKVAVFERDSNPMNIQTDSKETNDDSSNNNQGCISQSKGVGVTQKHEAQISEQNESENDNITSSEKNLNKDGNLIDIIITATKEENLPPVGTLNLGSDKLDNTDNSLMRSPLDHPKSPKKKVTIKQEVDFDTKTEYASEKNHIPLVLDSDNNPWQTTGDDEEINDWSSIFSRPSTAPKADPLQERVNSFLADQDVFNRTFPKGGEVPPEINDIQEELSHRAKAKTDIKKQEKKKKNDIIFEVLDKLGVNDPHIVAHYDIEK